MTDGPIFILSCARTGSTLLRFLLDTHPQVYAPPELHLGRLASDLYLTLAGLRGRDIGSIARKEDPDLLQEVAAHLEGLVDAAARRRGKQTWCEKSPANLEHRELLARLFPRARFICLHRCHADVVASCLESSRYGFLPVLAEYVARSPRDVLQALTSYWADGAAALLDFERRHRDRTWRLRYEDLVGEPEVTLEALFGFLGLPWSPGLLGAAFTTAHDPGIGDRHIRFSGKLLRDRVGAGRDIPFALGPDLEARVGALAAELGYATPPAPPAPPAPATGAPVPPVATAAAAAPAGDAAGQGAAWVFETHLPARLAARGELLAGLGPSYRFVVGGTGGGVWMLAAAGGRFTITPGDAPAAATTVEVGAEDLLAVVHGEMNALRALREGKIRATGRLPSNEEFQALVMLLRADL
jgi:protein-tyrosine sulfotransferase